MDSAEVASCDIIYFQSFINIGKGISPILKFFLRNLKMGNVGITDERVIRCTPLKSDQMV
jgi:hypothetical protein